MSMKSTWIIAGAILLAAGLIVGFPEYKEWQTARKAMQTKDQAVSPQPSPHDRSFELAVMCSSLSEQLEHVQKLGASDPLKYDPKIVSSVSRTWKSCADNLNDWLTATDSSHPLQRDVGKLQHDYAFNANALTEGSQTNNFKFLALMADDLRRDVDRIAELARIH